MLKLYAWQPRGHGEVSIFVMADSEDEAMAYVEAEVSRRKALDHTDGDHLGEYETLGWGTDYYTLTVVEKGTVVFNQND